MDREGRCLVFDYLDVAKPITSICLYYNRKVLEQGESWVMGQASDDASKAKVLLAFLEPEKVNLESETRNQTTEQLIYSFSEQSNPWFVSLLLPCSEKTRPQSFLKNFELRSIQNQQKLTVAQLMIMRQGETTVVYGCRQSQYAQMLLYPYEIHTNADLVRLEEKEKGIEVTLVNASILKHKGKTVMKQSFCSNFHTFLKKNI